MGSKWIATASPALLRSTGCAGAHPRKSDRRRRRRPAFHSLPELCTIRPAPGRSLPRPSGRCRISYMERLRLLGAAAGAVFAALTIVAFGISPGPSSAADTKVIEYYTEHGGAAIWSAVLAGFGIACFVWFAAAFSSWSPAGPAV